MHNLPMKLMIEIAGGLLAIIVLVVALLVIRRQRTYKQLNGFKTRWRDVQKLCGKAETWPRAIADADKLVDDVLRASGYKGRSMGERLVAAQRDLSDNDAVWFAHKLSGRIGNDEMARLYKKDVQSALRGHRQALQDLGVLA